MFLAIVLSAVVLFGWGALSETFFPQPAPAPAPVASTPAPQAAAPAVAHAPVAGAPVAVRTPAAVLAEGQRLKLRSPSLAGSINPTGARLDDLVLVPHRRTLAEDSPPVRLPYPAGTDNAYFLHTVRSGDAVERPSA